MRGHIYVWKASGAKQNSNLAMASRNVGTSYFARVSSCRKFQPSVESCDYLNIIRIILRSQYAMANKEFQQHESTIWLELSCRHRPLHFRYAQELEVHRLVVARPWDSVEWQLQIIKI